MAPERTIPTATMFECCSTVSCSKTDSTHSFFFPLDCGAVRRIRLKHDGDITLFFVDGFLADEEFAKPLKTARWRVLFEDDLVIAADRRVTDCESW
jgi:hypothetical protein